MTHYYAYDTNSTVNVSEPAQIQNAQITLRHIPKPNSISIANFTETTSLSPATGQFFCDYSPDTQFRDSNRLVHFNPADNGKSLTVNYVAIGTVFTADDANEIKAHMENASLHGGGSNASYQAGEGISISNDTIALKPATNSQLGGVKVGNDGYFCLNSKNELAPRSHPTYYLCGFSEDEMDADTGLPDPKYFTGKRGDIIYHIPRRELYLYNGYHYNAVNYKDGYHSWLPFCKPQKFNRAQLVNVQNDHQTPQGSEEDITDFYLDNVDGGGDCALFLPNTFINPDDTTGHLYYNVRLTHTNGKDIPIRPYDELQWDYINNGEAYWSISARTNVLWLHLPVDKVNAIVVHYTTDKDGNIYDYENPTPTFTSSSSAFPTDPNVATFCYRYDLNQLFLFDGLNWLAI